MTGSHCGNRFSHRGGMVREIVVHGDTVHTADHFEPPLDPAKPPQPFGQRAGRDAERAADGQRAERVPDVVQPEQRQLERADVRLRCCSLNRVTPSAISRS